ncbi:MAG: toll/interleukin-1 receptor domain-containing protein [Clostridia bacterium]|nr:toll/interleukin-1 receptor domain-containing protein [Clostridia bacterium]
MNYEKRQRAYLSYMKASCGEYANEITKALRSYGYGVFYDKKSPRSGEFKKDLTKAINNSNWFVIILDKHIFEDWNDKRNWIHIELSHAIQEKKRIIALKTPGLDVEAEMKGELTSELFSKFSEIIEIDKKDIGKTALRLREIIEKEDNVGVEEKAINRIFSGIYLWRIIFFPILGAYFMLGKISMFEAIYNNKGSAEVAVVFRMLGRETVYGAALLYIILGGLLCGAFMYVTRKIMKLDIIPLFLSDVAGIVVLSALARKMAGVVFPLAKAQYWASPVGEGTWSLCESTAIYMVVLTLVVQFVLYGYKRIRDFV